MALPFVKVYACCQVPSIHRSTTFVGVTPLSAVTWTVPVPLALRLRVVVVLTATVPGAVQYAIASLALVAAFSR